DAEPWHNASRVFRRAILRFGGSGRIGSLSQQNVLAQCAVFPQRRLDLPLGVRSLRSCCGLQSTVPNLSFEDCSLVDGSNYHSLRVARTSTERAKHRLVTLLRRPETVDVLESAPNSHIHRLFPQWRRVSGPAESSASLRSDDGAARCDHHESAIVQQ